MLPKSSVGHGNDGNIHEQKRIAVISLSPGGRSEHLHVPIIQDMASMRVDPNLVRSGWEVGEAKAVSARDVGGTWVCW